MKRCLLLLVMLCSVLNWGTPKLLAQETEPVISHEGAHLVVQLSPGVELRYLIDNDMLYGLNRALVNGVELSSAETVQRPVLAQEWGDDKQVWPFMKFKKAEVLEGKVVITATLLGTGTEAAYRSLFLFRGNIDRALERELPDELKQLKQNYEKIRAELEPDILSDLGVKKSLSRMERTHQRVDQAASDAEVKSAAWRIQRNLKWIRDSREKAFNQLIQQAGREKQHAQVKAYRAALAAYAMEHHGEIHRDHYRFPHLRQPAEVTKVKQVRADYALLKDELKEGGEFKIILEPLTQNIAGWKYEGWKQSYAFKLPGNQKINNLRQLGTWEIDGKAAGITLGAMRYRGLGRIEHVLQGDGDGKIQNAFSTTEVIPGAVGSDPLISPVIPVSKDVNDRGYALKHRVGAWICRMARGSGSPFVDHQFRPHATFISYFKKQGNLRALTEVMPGDRVISQTDEEYFENTNAGQTQVQIYLALVNRDKPLTIHENRNRWQEVDQYVRDLVSEELGFVQYEALPGVGVLLEFGWGPHKAFEWDKYYEAMAKEGLKNWADMGVKLVAVHNPGWVNGRYRGNPQDAETLGHYGGGVCDIYDWVPTKDMRSPWIAFHKEAAKQGIAYYPWLGQTHRKYTPFTERVGLHRSHWSLNGPNDMHAPGYGHVTLKGNIYAPNFRDQFVGTLNRTRRQYGFEGFWVDSMQNLMMSQLNWAGENKVGTSMQRGWWETLAKWSREGVGIMAESHAFPGMSCSIEIHGWEDDFWYMQHVWKWYRGGQEKRFNAEQLDRNLFRMMSVKSWTAPDHSHRQDAEFVIPSFKRMAQEYMKALPMMRRSYILPGGQGILWLPYDSDDEGVLFVYESVELPSKVSATGMLTPQARLLGSLKAQHTYHVKGGDLAAQLGVRQGTLKDPRFGRVHEMPKYDWTVRMVD